jgi:hypothetical protein
MDFENALNLLLFLFFVPELSPGSQEINKDPNRNQKGFYGNQKGCYWN